MKKIYTLTLAGLLVGAVSAQQANKKVTFNAKPIPAKSFQFNKSILNKVKPNPSLNSVGTSTWICYGDVMDQVASGGAGQSGASILNSNYLNTDSLLYGNFGGTYAGIWVNHLGDLIDISSPNYTAILGTTWDHSTAYSVDSVAIVYAYTRKVNFVDTLIFTLFTNTPATNMPGSYFTGGSTLSDWGSDTLFFKTFPYTYQSNTVNATGSKVTYKFPLHQADTAEVVYGMKYFKLPAVFSVPMGNLMGCGVTFKPGYPYVLGDSIDNRNAFYFTSYEENGAGTLPLYTDCNKNSPVCDYNSSLIVPNDVRYNMNSQGWDGYFLPAYAYTAPYAFEHHLIYYNVTQTNVGIKENTDNKFLFDQNIPNPFSGTTTIGYTLKNTAKSVKLDILDFSGRLITSQSETNVKPGYNTFTVEAYKLSKGVYFYTVNVDGLRMTKKMIVE